jgi:N4-gp56 family major capsid protein
MATFDGANAQGVTEVAAFIPEIWSDEIQAAFKSNLVVANLVKNMNHIGKKGDTIHIPKPVRGVATSKTSGSSVTLINDTATDFSVSINKHFEYSRLIDDIAEVQALPSLRSFYTEDAGYALARQIDTDINTLAQSLSTSKYMDASTNLTNYAADTVLPEDVFSDTGFREAIQLLDDADVPMDNRFLVVPPSVKKDILGEDRFNSSDFVSGRPVENGLLGDIYGVKIYISTNLAEKESDAENTATNGGRLVSGILGHRDAFILATQMDVRVQTQYQQQFLADLMTADCLYGVAELRDGAAIELVFNSDAVPATSAP